MTRAVGPVDLTRANPAVGWAARLPRDPRWWLVLSVRLALIVVFAVEMYVTGHRQAPSLLSPTAIGADPSNYYAAALRLNDGHNLYGPLVPGDLAVPGYPARYVAPLLSPPLVAVVWRLPAAVLGPTSMVLFWLGSIGLVTLLVFWFALRSQPILLATMALVLALGLPLTLAAGSVYRYPGFNSPLSFAALSGNINAYVLGLFVLVWWAAGAGHDRLAGVAAALATALKLGPIVLLWWFVVQRRWRSAVACMAALAALGLIGVLFAGVDANLDYARLTLSGQVQPEGFALAVLLRNFLHVTAGSYLTFVVVGLGLAAMFLLRQRPRASFAAAVLTTIFSSPVVLAGNLALLLAVAAPWAIDGGVTVHPATPRRPRPAGRLRALLPEGLP